MLSGIHPQDQGEPATSWPWEGEAGALRRTQPEPRQAGVASGFQVAYCLPDYEITCHPDRTLENSRKDNKESRTFTSQSPLQRLWMEVCALLGSQAASPRPPRPYKASLAFLAPLCQ